MRPTSSCRPDSFKGLPPRSVAARSPPLPWAAGPPGIVLKVATHAEELQRRTYPVTSRQSGPHLFARPLLLSPRPSRRDGTPTTRPRHVWTPATCGCASQAEVRRWSVHVQRQAGHAVDRPFDLAGRVPPHDPPSASPSHDGEHPPGFGRDRIGRQVCLESPELLLAGRATVKHRRRSACGDEDSQRFYTGLWL